MRELINLIESAQITEAFNIPLSYAQIITPDYVDELLDYGFESGHAHQSATKGPESNFDPFSFLRLLEELQDDGFIPENIDIENNDQVRPYLEKWLKKRVSYLKRSLSPMITKTNGGILVLRAIAVDETTAINISNDPTIPLGEFWSFTGGQVFWGDGPELHMEAVVNPSKIDWLTSFRRNINYVLGEEENEAFLPKGSPLKLTKMWYKHEQIPFTHPNRIT